MLTAWGDESGSIPQQDPGSYLISAALIEDNDVPEVRKAIEDIRLGNEPKVHWHGSTPSRRHELVELVASLPLIGFVVVHMEMGANDRRHRRKCLECLLPNLDGMSCRHITLESRGTQDESDRDVLEKFRSRKVITADMRLDHAIGRNEPVLAVADIVCGAVVQSRVGNHEYLAKLDGSIDVRHIGS